MEKRLSMQITLLVATAPILRFAVPSLEIGISLARHGMNKLLLRTWVSLDLLLLTLRFTIRLIGSDILILILSLTRNIGTWQLVSRRMACGASHTESPLVSLVKRQFP